MRYVDSVEQEKRELEVWLRSTNKVKVATEKERPQREERILSQKPKEGFQGQKGQCCQCCRMAKDRVALIQ